MNKKEYKELIKHLKSLQGQIKVAESHERIAPFHASLFIKNLDEALILLDVIQKERQQLIAYELKMRGCTDEQAEMMVDHYLTSKITDT